MNHKYFPKARSENLIVEQLDDEVRVEDTERDRAHCLNSTAAFVWRHCDGRRTAGDIARELHQGMPKPNAETIRSIEELVWLALSQLNRDHLLTEGFAPPRVPRITRREALLRVGIGAAIAVPIVASITAPTAVQAGTCGHTNSNCSTGAECCSGICSGGKCA